MRPLQSLTLEAMLEMLSTTFSHMPDPRCPKRVNYRLHDTRLSGFAMLFFQHPSLLECQRKMQQRRGRCNLETIFGVREVPSESQMRAILDGVPVALLRELVPAMCEKFRRAGWAKDFQSVLSSGVDHGAYYPLALDGSAYLHSTEVQCPSCVQRRDAEGTVHFRHTVVSATLGKAGWHRVLPLDVEEGHNHDGQDKQDCAVNAAKRLLGRVRQEHPRLPLVILGDDLYCPEPCILQLREAGPRHVLVCTPTSHPEVYKWVDDLQALGACEQGAWQEGPACRRRWFTYRVARSVPLTVSHRVWGTFVEVWEHDRAGQQVYPNAWFTDLEVEQANVSEVIWMGRSRWKIEHEPFHIHKNHGYELEHNYGHGTQTLSMVFSLLNLLAFIAHMILDRGDRLYQRCVATTSRRELWHTLRTTMRMLCVASWRQMLCIYLDEEPASPERTESRPGPSQSGPFSTPQSTGHCKPSKESATENLVEARAMVGCLRQRAEVCADVRQWGYTG